MRRALAAAITLASSAALVGGVTLTAAQASPHAAGRAATGSAVRHAAAPAAVVPAAARHEEFRIISTAASSRRQSVLATGGFVAGGYVVPGKVVSLRSTDKVVFRSGGFQMARHITRQWLPLPTRNCLVRETIHGTFSLSHGTGAFRGISGSGAFVMKIRGALRPAKGGCGGAMTVYQMITWAGGKVRR
jgi:hypothetical protein